MSDWLQLLKTQVEATSCAEVGRRVGYSRPAISHMYHGRYGASTDRIATRIVEVFGTGIECPYLRETLKAPDCKAHRSGPMPAHNPHRFTHWTACQACPLNPNRKRTPDHARD